MWFKCRCFRGAELCLLRPLSAAIGGLCTRWAGGSTAGARAPASPDQPHGTPVAVVERLGRWAVMGRLPAGLTDPESFTLQPSLGL
jgi:hypothetical protein